MRNSRGLSASNIKFPLRSHGFSLVEMAVVLVLFGLLIAAAAAAFQQWEERRYVEQTNSRLDTINQALLDYLKTHPSLPCVASASVPKTDANFGREIDCAGATVPGTYRSQNPGRGDRAVRIGAVPVRTLNLSNDYIADPKGNLFTYAVTEDLVNDPIDNSKGAIEILDENNNSVLTPSGAGLYILLSHGKDAKGAYTYDGSVQGAACNSSPGMDQENCDGDFTFSAAQFSTAVSNRHFDDFIFYSTYVLPNCGLTGEIFDGTICVAAAGTNKGGYTENLDGVCRHKNIITNACSCPAGYNALQILDFNNPTCALGFYADNGRTTNCGIRSYLCIKD